MDVAEQIVVMNDGRVEQAGKPTDLYDHPETEFVMSFVGPVNVLRQGNPLVDRIQARHTEDGGLFIRPHDVVIVAENDAGTLPARVQRVTHLGWDISVVLALADDHDLTVHLTRAEFERLESVVQVGQTVNVRPRAVPAYADYSI